MEFLSFIGDVGFPIASALAGGFFVFLTLKFILAGVLDDITLDEAESRFDEDSRTAPKAKLV